MMPTNQLVNQQTCFLFFLLLLFIQAQVQENDKEIEHSSLEQDLGNNNSWPSKPPFDFMAPNCTIPAKQGPWNLFKGWVSQAKQNTARILGKAGNDIENFASNASKVIHNRTQDLGKKVNSIGNQNNYSESMLEARASNWTATHFKDELAIQDFDDEQEKQN